MALFLLSLVFGGGALWFARRLYAQIRVGRAWPTVTGTILARGVGAPMKAHGRMFLPHVEYTYDVAGTAYTNDQVYLVRDTGDRRPRIQKLVDDLPSSLPVHYDPADPSRSFLLVNRMGTVWLLTAAGVGAILLAPVHLAG